MPRQSSRDLWAAYLRDPSRRKNAPAPDAVTVPRNFSGFVLGIDPSLRGTGLAVVEARAGRFTLHHAETVRMAARIPAPDCLAHIHQRTVDVLKAHGVDFAAVEGAIYVQNFQTAISLGTARGASICAVAQAGVPIREYPPLRVKQAVIGFGRASKEQVRKTVAQLTGTDPETLGLDESDAVATALCHALTYRGEALG